MNMHRLRHPVTAVLATGLVLSIAMPAQAALNGYLTLKGERQGQITGGVVMSGKEGTIEVFSTEHMLKVPFDAATGMASGKRQHGVFTVRKSVDKSSPKLYTALTRNEAISEWTLKFYMTDASGREVNHYTVRLTNAHVASIKLVQLNTKDPAMAKMPLQEEVSFTYQNITWTWNDGGISSEDSWGSTAM